MSNIRNNENPDQPIGGRTGGVYIPPFKLALMRQALENKSKSDDEYQRLKWEALRKSINGLINKVNVGNIKNIIPELFQENLILGRGLFARAIMKAQLASPGFTHIYAALVAVVNTKLPENGELILKRVIYSFKRAYKRRDKIVATALAKFIAHLVNHQVAHELLALQLLTVLLEEPTDDSVEIAVNFTKEVGQIIEELSPQGLHAIFERFRGILHEGDIDKRVQYTVEALFAIRKSGFKDYPAIPSELDLIEREDQITFEIGLDDEIDKEEMLDIYRYDPNYDENELFWEKIKKDILGDEDDNEEDDNNNENENDENIENNQLDTTTAPDNKILDYTQQDLINLRRTIYLTIMSALSYEECCHKLMKLQIPSGYENELCNMIVECCTNEKSYLKYYGYIGQRFCELNNIYKDTFDQVFLNQYNTIHRLETNKLRNIAKFFAHLLSTDAISWTCFDYIKLNEYDTTSSSRIFIKIIIQEIIEALGINQVKERFNDVTMEEVFSGLFPKDNPRNTRFAINFFTSIGLGGLTDNLREYLKNAPLLLAKQMKDQLIKNKNKSSDTDSSSDSSTSSDSDSDSDGSSSSSSSSSSDSDSDSDSSSSSSRSSSSSSSTNSSTKSSISSNSKIAIRKQKTNDKSKSIEIDNENDKLLEYKKKVEEMNRRGRPGTAPTKQSPPITRRKRSPSIDKASPIGRRNRSPSNDRRSSPITRRKRSPSIDKRSPLVTRRNRSPLINKESPVGRRTRSPSIDKHNDSPVGRRTRSSSIDKRIGDRPNDENDSNNNHRVRDRDYGDYNNYQYGRNRDNDERDDRRYRRNRSDSRNKRSNRYHSRSRSNDYNKRKYHDDDQTDREKRSRR